MIAVPDIIRRTAASVGASAWLDAIPELVADLEREWDLTAGAVLPEGTAALVLEATLAGGAPAVLKLCVPDDPRATAREALVLRLADGGGCARLLRDDVERGALLLERLGPSMSTLGIPVKERHALLADAAARLWRPVPDADLPTGAEKGRWLVDQITTQWEELGHPCAEQTIDHAVMCAERRIAAHDDERAVLVHGDVHQWNALQADDAFKLVDPDGLRADAEYDLAIIMREDPEVDDLPDRADRLAALTGRDRTAIWEWGVVERVSTGLLGVLVDLQPSAGQMLAAADRISASSPRP